MALADRSDDFSALSLDPKWASFNAGAAWSIEYGPGGASGYVDIVVSSGAAAGMFWFDANDGPLLYPRDPADGDRVDIEGDFECEVELEVLNGAGDGPLIDTEQAKIGGVAGHLLPDPVTANPGVDSYTYFHAGEGFAPGRTGGSGRILEDKYTIANTTTWETVARAASNRARLLIRRIGSRVWVFVRGIDDTSWTRSYEGDPDPVFDRPMVVGLMAYSQATVPDMRARFHSITFREPRETMAATEYASGQLLDGNGLPATMYLGFSTSTPNPDGTGVTEPAGNAYARTAVTFAAADAAGARNASSTPVDVVDPTGAWGTITHTLYYDALTGGNLWFYNPNALGAVDTPQDVSLTSSAIRLTP